MKGTKLAIKMCPPLVSWELPAPAEVDSEAATPLGTTGWSENSGRGGHLEFRDSTAREGELELLYLPGRRPWERGRGPLGGRETGRGREEGETCANISLTDLFSFQT